MNKWHIHSIDFVLAFTQAPIKIDIFMRLPKVLHDFSIRDIPIFKDHFSKAYKDDGRT